MKKVTTILAAILLMAVGATAQKLSYSAVVRNSANELVANANITVAVNVTDGTNTYAESHAVTTNANGLVTLTIGEGTGATGSLSGMNWPAASITATYTLPGGATVTNTVPVNAVPYALYAETAGSGGGGGIVTETDPTVPAWAKEATKPAYDYSEITGTPTIPTVNDGTLTIQKNGAEVGTFTANQSGNTTVNITITAQDIIDAVNGMTDAEKAALCSALNCGGGSEPSDPTVFTCGTSKMVDADGNEYETVQIGTQCWTKTNLRVAPAGATDATSSGAYSDTEPYYYVKPGVDAATNGYYYNWEAAKLACPSGWHLPSDAEWNTLEATVSGSDWQESYVTATAYRGSHAGKLAGDGWNSSSTAGAPGNAADANHNASGFSAVPAGYWGDGFGNAGYNAYFWSSTEYGTNNAWNRSLNYDYAGVYRYGYYGRIYGFSVRCLRDETGGGTTYVQPTVTTSAATSVTQTSATLNGSVSNPDGVTITAQGFEWKATTGGTYAAVNATGETMTYNLTGLTAGTSYTYRAFVTTAAGTSYGDEVEFTTTASAPTVFTCGTSKMVDADGNEYETVLIGTQCWTKTNLRVAPAGATDATSSGAYSYTEPYYYVKLGVDAATNGYYYNWEAAKLACPSGWHLPSDAEWTTLTDYVSSQSEFQCGGNSNYIAKALASTEGWNSYSGECYPGDQSVTANNATGFSAVPAGDCSGSSFNGAGGGAFFWSSAQDYSGYAYSRYLGYHDANVSRGYSDENDGYSVRCLRDETGGGTASTEPTAFTCGTSKMVDADGNEYETVLIGTQCWTRTNLRTTTPSVAGSVITDQTSSGAYSSTEPYYYVNSAVDASTYGYYYNWPAAQLVCPAGWHLPSDAEWTTLTDYVGGQSEYQCNGNSSYIAKALASTEGWKTNGNTCAVGNNPSANNASGFGAVPAGYWGNGFNDAGNNADFWSFTEDGSSGAWNRNLDYYYADVARIFNGRYNGFSVRCLRDETGGGTASTEPTVTTSGATDVTETSATLNGSVSNPDGVTITAQGFEWKTTTGGTYAAVNATGETMTYNLTGLTAGTSYTYRAFVTTAEGTAYGSEVDFTTTAGTVDPTTFTCGTSKMVDADGNEYETVLIGTQCWTKTNMRTTTSAVASAAITDATSSDAYSYTEPYYYVNGAVDAAVYGYYYNWEAAKVVCPAGWHLPSDAEWNTLEETVSGTDWQANYAIATGYRGDHAGKLAGEGWNASSTVGAPGNATDPDHNASGFGAVPAGSWFFGFFSAGGYAHFWSSTESGTYHAWARDLGYDDAGVGRYNNNTRDFGVSVRCLRD